MLVLDDASMREADRATIHDRGVPSLTLMERVGAAVAEQARRMRGQGRVVVVCGKGGNGGDGLVAARLLEAARVPVVALLLAPEEELVADAATNLRRAREAGVDVAFRAPDGLSAPDLEGADVVVDAIFGTGLSGPVAEPWASALRTIAAHAARGGDVLSVDLPSGISGSSAALVGDALRATRTVAIQAPKVSHVLLPAAELCGEVLVADVGIDIDGARAGTRLEVVEARDAVAAFAPRPRDSHKLTYGRLLVVAGSRGMPGALALAAHGALVGGAGLVTVASVRSAVDLALGRFPDLLRVELPESSDGSVSEEAIAALVVEARRSRAVLIGPGLGRNESIRRLVLALAREVSVPLVIDADGLNAVADARGVWELARRRSATVLTPHPGELRRLSADDGTDRVARARKMAAESGSIVLLKGYRSLVAEPGGRVRVCMTGGPALARGGTGDVLAGLLASIVARGVAATDAAAAAAYLHGLAGDLLAAERGEHMVLASELPSALSQALRVARSRTSGPQSELGTGHGTSRPLAEL